MSRTDRERWDRRSRRWPGRLLALLAASVFVAGGLVAAVRGGWLAGGVVPDGSALARLEVPVQARLVSLRVEGLGGRLVPVRLADGRLWPRVLLGQGEQLSVSVSFVRSGMWGFLLGRRQRVRLVLTTPRAQLEDRWLHYATGEAVVLRFRQPVQEASIRIGGSLVRAAFARPRVRVATGVVARGSDASGRALVAAAPRPWQRLSAPVEVSWYPAGGRLTAQVVPASGTTVRPWQPVRLSFSRSLAAVFGRRLPRVAPAGAGSWRRLDSHTLLLEPAGGGFPLAGRLSLTLPAPVAMAGDRSATTEQQLAWPVVGGSTLRLQQLLAQLGYLPLAWRPAQPARESSQAAQLEAALHPPTGRFGWRYPNVPPQLAALWRPDRANTLTQAAVMAFEDEHGLRPDGIAGPKVWRLLLADATAGRLSLQHGYSYVLVHRQVPQTLSLWHDGRILLIAHVNTGVPAAPTQLGSYPVWLRLASQTMKGTNPNGSHYSDAGIRWISYFHGGEAIHGFDRASYGFPQSVGCVELPVAAAHRLWPYTPIGTPVTIAN